MTINQKRKGKRIELDFVHWLKENNIPSARRSEQYNGAAGLSDVLAPTDLPHWHIEVKGVKAAKIPRSIITSWVAQVKRDIKNEELGVIAFKPNGLPFMCAILHTDWHRIQRARRTIENDETLYVPMLGDSIEPHKEYEAKLEWLETMDSFSYGPNHTPKYNVVLAYRVKIDGEMVSVQIMDAARWLKIATDYEMWIKNLLA